MTDGERIRDRFAEIARIASRVQGQMSNSAEVRAEALEQARMANWAIRIIDNELEAPR